MRQPFTFMINRVYDKFCQKFFFNEMFINIHPKVDKNPYLQVFQGWKLDESFFWNDSCAVIYDRPMDQRKSCIAIALSLLSLLLYSLC